MPAKKTQAKARLEVQAPLLKPGTPEVSARTSFADALEVIRAGIDAEIEANKSDAARCWSLVIVRKGLKGL